MNDFDKVGDYTCVVKYLNNITMFCQDGYVGCPKGIEDLRNMNKVLSAKVLEQVNTSQELVMMNDFSKETSEYLFQKCLQERMANIASWRWVLEDLSTRLHDVINALKYEHNAIRVVIERVRNELNDHSREASRPGALKPNNDETEDVIMEEHNFLRDEKKKFEEMIIDLEKETAMLEKTKKRIDSDLKNKEKALTVEEACGNIDNNYLNNMECPKSKKKKFSPVTRWENRCASLKRAGLKGLSSALITRQQVRGARVQLSIAAQAYAARVDSALRKRLHVNTVKLQELQWQRDEAIRDIKALDEELTTAEQNLLDTMEQERLIAARIADRRLRPVGESTKDDVDKRLRDEIVRIRTFMKHLRENIDRIKFLQNKLSDTISKFDCCAEDISRVTRLDQDRIHWRLGEMENVSQSSPVSSSSTSQHMQSRHGLPLSAIIEEDEEDDYPLDY